MNRSRRTPLSPPSPARQATPPVWTFSTYFAEGFPYSIIRTVSAVFFREAGMRLEEIGLTSLFSLPWILKFLWAPQVDRFGTKRQWLLASEIVLAAAVLAAAVMAPASWGSRGVAILFFLAAFLAATHDVAIDGYYLEALDVAGQARFLGYRVMAYRIAMMTGSGVIVTIGARSGWEWGFAAAGLLLAGLSGFHFFWLPRCERARQPLSRLLAGLLRPRPLVLAMTAAGLVFGLRAALTSPWYLSLQQRQPIFQRLGFAAWVSILLLLGLIGVVLGRRRLHRWMDRHQDLYYARAFLSFLDQERAGVVLAFIVLVRSGEFMLSAMTAPFLVDLGLTLHYGWISAGVGLPCSIAGAMVGGWLISRHGLRRMIWPFLWAQNLTNLVYMGLAFWLTAFLAVNTGNPQPIPLGAVRLATVALVHGFDQLAGGLGTAVLMTYLMRLCRPEHKAAHYAIGTGVMSVSSLYAGVASGFLAAWLGYGLFFGVSFLCSLPGMALAMLVPLADKDQAAAG